MSEQEKRLGIKSWLKKENISRTHLADLCGVSLSTVNGWLSKKPVPEKAWRLIQKLMSETGNNRIRIARHDLKINFSGDIMEKLMRAAYSSNSTVEELVHKLITEAAENPEMIRNRIFSQGGGNRFQAAEELGQYDGENLSDE